MGLEECVLAEMDSWKQKYAYKSNARRKTSTFPLKLEKPLNESEEQPSRAFPYFKLVFKDIYITVSLHSFPMATDGKTLKLWLTPSTTVKGCIKIFSVENVWLFQKYRYCAISLLASSSSSTSSDPEIKNYRKLNPGDEILLKGFLHDLFCLLIKLDEATPFKLLFSDSFISRLAKSGMKLHNKLSYNI